MFYEKLFFLQKLFQDNFLYCLRFFILTKNLNTAHTPTEMKKTCCIEFFPVKIFVSFCQVIKQV